MLSVISKLGLNLQCFFFFISPNTGNVVKGNRKVYAKRIFTGTSEHDLRDKTKCQQPSKFSRIVFFTVLQLYIYKKGNTILFSIYVCIRNERIGHTKRSIDYFYLSIF